MGTIISVAVMTLTSDILSPHCQKLDGYDTTLLIQSLQIVRKIAVE
jgi:hypothetical protein